MEIAADTTVLVDSWWRTKPCATTGRRRTIRVAHAAGVAVSAARRKPSSTNSFPGSDRQTGEGRFGRAAQTGTRAACAPRSAAAFDLSRNYAVTAKGARSSGRRNAPPAATAPNNLHADLHSRLGEPEKERREIRPPIHDVRFCGLNRLCENCRQIVAADVRRRISPHFACVPSASSRRRLRFHTVCEGRAPVALTG